MCDTTRQYDESMVASKYNSSSLLLDKCELIEVSSIKTLISHIQKPLSHQPYERALDIGCGAGYMTRVLARDGIAQFVVGIDVSEAMIKLAEKAVQHEKEHFQYLVMKANDFQPIIKMMGQFPLIVSINMLCHMANVDELYQMLLGIRQLCAGFFVGIIPGPFYNPENTTKLQKYGMMYDVSDTPCDGDKIHVSFDCGTKNEFKIADFWYHQNTYESLFRKAGFATFEWVPIQVSSDATKEQQLFFADLSQLYIGFIAGV